MAKKRAERIRRRVTCELLLEGRSYRGIVLDLSETGVFVQTEATPQPGARLVLRIHAPSGVEIEVAASVARRKVAPRELAGVVRGGLGLRVESPPPAYFELIGSADPVASAASAGASGPRAGLGAGSRVASAAPASARREAPAAPPRAPAPAPAAPPPDTRPEFRVRAKQSEGPRSRTIKVRAASSDEARRAAMRELGAGWEILSVEAA